MSLQVITFERDLRHASRADSASPQVGTLLRAMTGAARGTPCEAAFKADGSSGTKARQHAIHTPDAGDRRAGVQAACQEELTATCRQ